MRRLIVPSVILILAWGFWLSPEFMQVSAGVAIFMFGMLSLEEGFQTFTGGILERVLDKATKGPLRSLLFGLVTTTLMQSSSLVSLLSITFLSAGLISLAQGIGIIFGSNIGTTTGAWLMATAGVKMDIAAFALPMLVFGILLIFQSDRKLKAGGQILFGVSLLFLGITNMKEGFESLSQSIDLSQFAMEGLAGLFIYALIGIVATVVMQSSHAVLMLTIAALATGQVTYENGLALAIGANVGTTITAVLGALNANAAGRRLAGAHMIFNVGTGLLAITLIQPLMGVVDSLAEWLGIAADDYTLKLALFHTLFNVLGVVVFMPLVGWMVRLLERMIPEKPVVEAGVEQPIFLNKAALEFPDAALVALDQELKHLALNASDIITRVLQIPSEEVFGEQPIKELVAGARKLEDVSVKELYRTRIKGIYSRFVEFATEATPQMTPQQADAVYGLRSSARELVESVKAMRLLKRNIGTYLNHENEHMCAEYDRIRAHLASMLREIHLIREEVDLETAVSRLEALKDSMAGDDILANGRLDELIRGGHVTREMATSLMNDYAYAYQVLDSIVGAAERVFRIRRGDLYSLAAEPDEATTDESLIARREELLTFDGGPRRGAGRSLVGRGRDLNTGQTGAATTRAGSPCSGCSRTRTSSTDGGATHSSKSSGWNHG